MNSVRVADSGQTQTQTPVQKSRRQSVRMIHRIMVESVLSSLVENGSDSDDHQSPPPPLQAPAASHTQQWRMQRPIPRPPFRITHSQTQQVHLHWTWLITALFMVTHCLGSFTPDPPPHPTAWVDELNYGDLSDSLINALIILSRLAASLSLCGSALVLFTYLRVKTVRNEFSNRFILYLSCNDLLASLILLFGRFDDATSIRQPDQDANWIQYLRSTLLQHVLLSSVIWSSCMATNHLLMVRFSVDVAIIRKLEKFEHLLVWSASFVTNIIIWFTNAYGDGFLWSWCGFGNSRANFEISLWVFYIPVFLCLVFNLIAYTIIIRHGRKVTEGITQAAGSLQAHPSKLSRVQTDSDMPTTPQRPKLLAIHESTNAAPPSIDDANNSGLPISSVNEGNIILQGRPVPYAGFVVGHSPQLQPQVIQSDPVELPLRRPHELAHHDSAERSLSVPERAAQLLTMALEEEEEEAVQRSTARVDKNAEPELGGEFEGEVDEPIAEKSTNSHDGSEKSEKSTNTRQVSKRGSSESIPSVSLRPTPPAPIILPSSLVTPDLTTPNQPLISPTFPMTILPTPKPPANSDTPPYPRTPILTAQQGTPPSCYTPPLQPAQRGSFQRANTTTPPAIVTTGLTSVNNYSHVLKPAQTPTGPMMSPGAYPVMRTPTQKGSLNPVLLMAQKQGYIEKRLVGFIVAFIATWMFSWLNVGLSIGTKEVYSPLLILQLLGLCLGPLFNSLAYGINSRSLWQLVPKCLESNSTIIDLLGPKPILPSHRVRMSNRSAMIQPYLGHQRGNSNSRAFMGHTSFGGFGGGGGHSRAFTASNLGGGTPVFGPMKSWTGLGAHSRRAGGSSVADESIFSLGVGIVPATAAGGNRQPQFVSSAMAAGFSEPSYSNRRVGSFHSRAPSRLLTIVDDTDGTYPAALSTRQDSADSTPKHGSLVATPNTGGRSASSSGPNSRIGSRRGSDALVHDPLTALHTRQQQQIPSSSSSALPSMSPFGDGNEVPRPPLSPPHSPHHSPFVSSLPNSHQPRRILLSNGSQRHHRTSSKPIIISTPNTPPQMMNSRSASHTPPRLTTLSNENRSQSNLRHLPDQTIDGQWVSELPTQPLSDEPSVVRTQTGGILVPTVTMDSPAFGATLNPLLRPPSLPLTLGDDSPETSPGDAILEAELLRALQLAHR